MLSKLLSYTRALYQFYHFAHFQTKGPNYYADHLLLQRLYESVQAEIDGIGEKAVGLFGADSIDVADDAQMTAKLLMGWRALRSEHSVMDVALKAERDYQEFLASLLGELKKQDKLDDGLENFLQGLADAHQTNLYLLQQRTATKEAKASDHSLPKSELIAWLASSPDRIDHLKDKWGKLYLDMLDSMDATYAFDPGKWGNKPAKFYEWYFTSGQDKEDLASCESMESRASEQYTDDMPDDAMIKELERLRKEQHRKHEDRSRMYLPLPEEHQERVESEKPEERGVWHMDLKRKASKGAIFEELDETNARVSWLFDKFGSAVKMRHLKLADDLVYKLSDLIQALQEDLRNAVNERINLVSPARLELTSKKLQSLQTKLDQINKYRAARAGKKEPTPTSKPLIVPNKYHDLELTKDHKGHAIVIDHVTYPVPEQFMDSYREFALGRYAEDKTGLLRYLINSAWRYKFDAQAIASLKSQLRKEEEKSAVTATLNLGGLLKTAYMLDQKALYTEADKIEELVKTLALRVGLNTADVLQAAQTMDELGCIEAADTLDVLAKQAKTKKPSLPPKAWVIRVTKKLKSKHPNATPKKLKQLVLALWVKEA
jgi:DNA-binding ferritin-like protein